MNYIVFDLEWNQCPYGKEKSNPKLPFEIIEIGGVKLSEDGGEISRFHRIVRPRVYKLLHHRTRKIVHLDMEELKHGTDFPEAVRDFLYWSGRHSVFCTWGNSDLLELQRNLRFYGMLKLLPGPLHYLNVQKLFSIAYEDGEKRSSLSDAAEMLGISGGGDFHSAMDDALYTARIFARIDPDLRYENESIDTYQHPRSKTDEMHVDYRDRTLFISREFANRDEAAADPEVRSFRCFRCGKRIPKKIRWFSSGAHKYLSCAVCREHGLQKGMIRIRETEERRYYVVKQISRCGEDEVRKIRTRQRQMREKRRKKRAQLPPVS